MKNLIKRWLGIDTLEVDVDTLQDDLEELNERLERDYWKKEVVGKTINAKTGRDPAKIDGDSPKGVPTEDSEEEDELAKAKKLLKENGLDPEKLLK